MNEELARKLMMYIDLKINRHVYRGVNGGTDVLAEEIIDLAKKLDNEIRATEKE